MKTYQSSAEINLLNNMGKIVDETIELLPPTELDMVMELHNKMLLKVELCPKVPTQDIKNRRIKLIQEEFDELKKSFDDNNLVESFDAILDLLYVVYGTAIELGLQDILYKGFCSVHESNMSKVCYNQDEVQATIIQNQDRYEGMQGVRIGDNEYLVKDSMGKLIKSIFYKKVDLASIIADEISEHQAF